jgi:hypothetical protein
VGETTSAAKFWTLVTVLQFILFARQKKKEVSVFIVGFYLKMRCHGSTENQFFGIFRDFPVGGILPKKSNKNLTSP